VEAAEGVTVLDIIDEIRSKEHKADRMTLREKVVVVLGIIMFFVLLGMAVPAMAATRIVKTGNDYVRLYDAPCTSKVVIELMNANGAGQYVHLFKQAEADVDGKHFQACYRESVVPEGLYIFIFDDGDTGIIPQEAFQAEGV
jgi:hypothetical protein